MTVAPHVLWGVPPSLDRALRALLAVSALATASACGEELPPIVWEGEHVRVGTDLDLDDWCPGNLPRLDGFTSEMKGLFGAPDDIVVDYYLVEPPVSDHAPCDGDAAACQLEANVFSPFLPHDHEVVHALGTGLRGGLFEEGRASYFGDAFPIDWHTMDGLDVRAFIESWSHDKPAGRYRLAAHFTAYLVHTYGLDAYLELVRGSNREQPRDEFESAFEQALGLPLDAAIDDYEVTWPVACGPDSPRYLQYECSREPISLQDGARVEIDLELSCADPEALGPRPDATGVSRIWRDITIEHDGHEGDFFEFEVPESGADSSVVVQIIPCSTDCRVLESEARIFVPRDDPAVWNGWNFAPAAGRYVMRVSADADAAESVRIVFR